MTEITRDARIARASLLITYMPSPNTLIVMALPQESRGELERAGAQDLYTGVGKVNAALSLARRLAVIMHRIWVDGTEFRWSRQAATAA